MQLVKLVIGWLAICVLTAAGSYYGAIELDQDLGLQAKICSKCLAASSGTPRPVPDPVPSQPVPKPVPDPAPSQPVPKPTPYPVTPSPVNPQPVNPQPAPRQANPQPSPRPTFDGSDLLNRYNALLDRANTINNEFTQIEKDLRSQGLPMRGDITSARQSMIQSLATAAAAIRSHDASTASRALQVAEQKLDFLEQSR